MSPTPNRCTNKTSEMLRCPKRAGGVDGPCYPGSRSRGCWRPLLPRFPRLCSRVPPETNSQLCLWKLWAKCL